MNRFFIASICIVTTFTVSCSGLNPRPQDPVESTWLAEIQTQYPDNTYYSGISSGDSLDSAANNALDTLAREISLGVLGSEAQTRGTEGNAPEHSHKWTSASELSSKIIDIVKSGGLSVSSSKISGEKTYVATFVARSDLARSIGERTASLESEIGKRYQAALSVEDALEQIASAYQLVKLISERYYLNEVQRQADPSLPIIASEFDPATYSAGFEILLSTVILIAESHDPRISQVLQKSIEEAGFNRNPPIGRVPYILESRLTSDVTGDSGQYFLKGEITINVKRSNTTGPIKGTARWPLNVAAQDEAKLTAAMLNEIAQLSKAELKQKLVELALMSQM